MTELESEAFIALLNTEIHIPLVTIKCICGITILFAILLMIWECDLITIFERIWGIAVPISTFLLCCFVETDDLAKYPILLGIWVASYVIWIIMVLRNTPRATTNESWTNDDIPLLREGQFRTSTSKILRKKQAAYDTMRTKVEGAFCYAHTTKQVLDKLKKNPENLGVFTTPDREIDMLRQGKFRNSTSKILRDKQATYDAPICYSSL